MGTDYYTEGNARMVQEIAAAAVQADIAAQESDNQARDEAEATADMERDAARANAQ